MEADLSLPTLRIIRVLRYLKEFRGLPQMIRTDNGPEFISDALDQWCRENKITLAYIQPGKPTQNAYVERCNGNIRREFLNVSVFQTLSQVKQKMEECLIIIIIVCIKLLTSEHQWNNHFMKLKIQLMDGLNLGKLKKNYTYNLTGVFTS